MIIKFSGLNIRYHELITTFFSIQVVDIAAFGIVMKQD